MNKKTHFLRLFMTLNCHMMLFIVFVLSLTTLQPAQVKAASNEQQRQEALIGLGLKGGIYLPTMRSFPVFSGDWYVTENIVLGYDLGFKSSFFAGGSATSSDSEVYAEENYEDARYQGFRIKYFIGDWMYLMIGSHMVSWKGTAEIHEHEKSGSFSSGGDYYGEISFDNRYQVVSLGIGNQWNFSNGLYIGIDWALLPYASHADFNWEEISSENSEFTAEERQEAYEQYEDEQKEEMSDLGFAIITFGYFF